MSVDIVMAISDTGGTWIDAEALAALGGSGGGQPGGASDPLTSELQVGKLFEVTDFSFGVGLQDKKDDDNSEEIADLEAKVMQLLQQDARAGGKTKKRESVAKFSEWMRNTPKWRVREQQGGYPLDMQEFRLTRFVDRGSPFLFEALCNSWTLKKGTLIKRKVSGTDGLAQTYLRFDFADILITSLDWDVEDVVQEKLKFICRAARVTYRPQTNTGAMGSAVSRDWDPLGKLDPPSWG